MRPSGFEKITHLITATLLQVLSLPKIKVAIPDATDMPANCRGFGKKNVPVLPHAPVGKSTPPMGQPRESERKKSGQSPYFVGYKKHTLRLWIKIKGSNRLVPLVSFMESANVFEGYFLKPMIQKSQDEFALSMDIVVADMGYLGGDQKKELREQWQTAVEIH